MWARRSDVLRLNSCPALLRTPPRSSGGAPKLVRSAGGSRLSNPASSSASAMAMAASGASCSTAAALPFASFQFSASVASARASVEPMPKYRLRFKSSRIVLASSGQTRTCAGIQYSCIEKAGACPARTRNDRSERQQTEGSQVVDEQRQHGDLPRLDHCISEIHELKFDRHDGSPC